MTVSARGSNPGTVTGVTWLLSSFFLASWSDEHFYFFSSSPGSTTTSQSGNLRLASGAGFCVSRWGNNPSGSLSLMGCPVEKIR